MPYRMGLFIKDVINQGEGVCQKMILLNKLIFVKMITKGGGGQKITKN